MTQPRNVRPNVTWFVTRRHFIFSPDKEGKVEQIYWYTTAVIAQRLDVQLHIMQLMSSHLHETLTDRLGVLPRFFELRNRLFANALKVLLGWPEEVFAKTPANWVELSTPEAVIKEMAYTAANCVEAGLVRTPRRWPGAKVLVDEVGRKTITVERPEGYFDPENPMWPERVSIPSSSSSLRTCRWLTHRCDLFAALLRSLGILPQALPLARVSRGAGWLNSPLSSTKVPHAPISKTGQADAAAVHSRHPRSDLLLLR